MRSRLLFLVVFTVLVSCKEQQARRPKDHSTTNFYKELIEKNKKLNRREKHFLESILAKDTINSYLNSSSGFWYTYQIKDSLATLTPKSGDIVTLEYSVEDIFGKNIYPTQKIVYKVDKQDLIPALQDGVKLMKQGETLIFVIPSYCAFGITGDGNKIGSNQPIKSKVTLVNIKSNNNESK